MKEETSPFGFVLRAFQKAFLRSGFVFAHSSLPSQPIRGARFRRQRQGGAKEAIPNPQRQGMAPAEIPKLTP
jgi:hypothetical protein